MKAESSKKTNSTKTITERHYIKVQSNSGIISYMRLQGCTWTNSRGVTKINQSQQRNSRNQYLFASYNSATTKVVPVCQSWLSKLTVACRPSQATTNWYSVPKGCHQLTQRFNLVQLPVAKQFQNRVTPSDQYYLSLVWMHLELKYA
jgi:hypothetical protein